MEFKINPAIIIFILGIGGLIFLSLDDSGEIGSKIPIALLFVFIIIIGIIIQISPEDKINGIFGEVDVKREFG